MRFASGMQACRQITNVHLTCCLQDASKQSLVSKDESVRLPRLCPAQSSPPSTAPDPEGGIQQAAEHALPLRAAHISHLARAKVAVSALLHKVQVCKGRVITSNSSTSSVLESKVDFNSRSLDLITGACA